MWGWWCGVLHEGVICRFTPGYWKCSVPTTRRVRPSRRSDVPFLAKLLRLARSTAEVPRAWRRLPRQRCMGEGQTALHEGFVGRGSGLVLMAIKESGLDR